jgi:hypothetical protein
MFFLSQYFLPHTRFVFAEAVVEVETAAAFPILVVLSIENVSGILKLAHFVKENDTLHAI